MPQHTAPQLTSVSSHRHQVLTIIHKKGLVLGVGSLEGWRWLPRGFVNQIFSLQGLSTDPHPTQQSNHTTQQVSML